MFLYLYGYNILNTYLYYAVESPRKIVGCQGHPTEKGNQEKKMTSKKIK